MGDESGLRVLDKGPAADLTLFLAHYALTPQTCLTQTWAQYCCCLAICTAGIADCQLMRQ